MHLENSSNNNRTDWKYVYLSKDLLPKAEQLVKDFEQKDSKLRKTLSDLTLDKTISMGSTEIDKVRRELETNSRLLEECHVYVHEFKRTPEVQHYLMASDVVFFGYPDTL